MQPKSATQYTLMLWMVRAGMIVMLVSLVLHAFQLFVIFRTRVVVQQQVALLANQVEEARDDTISLDLQLNQPVPIRADVPIEQNVTIPISTTVRINDEISIPINTPFGSYTLPIPVQTDVPIRMTVPITVDETVNISTTIELDMNVPINLDIDDTSLADYLDRLHEHLTELQDTLQ